MKVVKPVYERIGGPGSKPFTCIDAMICTGCTICQMRNEVARRKAAGQPIVAPMVMMAPMQMQGASLSDSSGVACS
jgi:hypothetical protein